VSIYGEVPSGAVNGTNTVFTTSQPYYEGSTRVYLGTNASDCYRLQNGVAYTETTPASGVLTFATAPASGSVIFLDYDIVASYTIGEWTFNSDGSAVYNGPTLFPAGIKPGSTQTVVCVFGPGGAKVMVPALAQGESGLPPELSIGTISTLAAGSDVTASWTEVSPGGPGVAGEQALNLGIPQGAAGESGEFSIAGATDLVGSLENLFTLVYNSATSKFNPVPLPFLFAYNVTGIATTSTSAGQIRTIQDLTIPEQAQPYLLVVAAQIEVEGTANTQVDLVARLGGSADTQDGTEIGRGFGQLGAAPAPATIIPEWTALLDGGSTEQVAASTAATVYLNCEQQASTTDEYSTNRCNFTVLGVPLAS
jgi:hypothetical protein